MSNDQHDIHIERVEIPCDGETIVGLLFLPVIEDNTPSPALVFLGPLTSVKEQVPGNYAEAMATRGFVSLAIDNRHFGESTGTPRQYEHPGKKVEDIRAALDWLEAREEVDNARLGAVGICAGAGYISGAVADDRRIGAFGAVAGFYHFGRKTEGVDGRRLRARPGARSEGARGVRGVRRGRDDPRSR